jgi:hypothetical protein
MCNECKYGKYIKICDGILEDWDNSWCWDTIEGIKNWVLTAEHITEKQIIAIENIQEKLHED